MRGIWMSIVMTSGRSSAARRMASSPSRAVPTISISPSRSNSSIIHRRMNDESSTTSTRRRAGRMGGAETGRGAGMAGQAATAVRSICWVTALTNRSREIGLIK